ncbi:hypothetical protein ACB092_02G131700 [Castanea dentata]
MYGRKACQLVKELASGEKADLFDQVIAECSQHHLDLQSLIRKMQEEGLDVQTTRNADHYGALTHHLFLVRNKCCLMAYVLIWKVGPVLPQEIQEKLSHTEEDHFKKHAGTLQSYMSRLDLDLTVDMVPLKDPYIQVRVLDNFGVVLSDDKTTNFARHSMHFLKRTDAEQFISRVGCPQ